MNDKTIEKIKKYGYTDVRLLSEGGHGQCFLVRDGKHNYKILKRYFKNDKAEAKHEENVLGCVHGKTKGNAFFFKVDAITHEKETFLLMSTNEGKTLRELKDDVNENLSLFQATEIIISACYAISDLHKAKYVHMDIKPENLYFVPKTKQVVPLDFGSSKKIRKKRFSTIINGIGYCSTEGYMTKRLQDFCEKRKLFSQINTTDEQKISLIEDEKKLGLQEDIYSLLCTYWFLLTNLNNWGVWNQDFCYLTTEEKIRLTLEKEDIPTYLISPLVELFMTIDAPCKDAEAEVPFSSVSDLIMVLEKIKEIEEEKEWHPEVIFKKSLEHFLEDCKTTIKEELLCNILKKISASESEELSVSLAEYILNNLKNHNNIQLVSEGGAGKSFQLLFTYKKLFDVSATKKIIPLYIPMNRYNEEKNFIKDYIVAQYVGRKQNGQEDENNRNLLKDSIENHDYTFYLIIDSINESSAYPDVAYSEIKEISKWNNTRIVVASRNVSELLSSFDQIELQKLTKDYLEINIPDFKGLNQSLRDLLGLPFYFERYLEIDCSDKEQITSAAELIETYHNWMLENIEKESVSPEEYSSFLRQLITEFLPEFSCKQMFSLHPLDFKDKDFKNKWDEFKINNYVPFERPNYLHILKELGIIKVIDNHNYAFCHQNTYTYFVAKYISSMIEENQTEGDSLLVDITDNYILRMVGELLSTSDSKYIGEHKFENKESLERQKSPIEEKLDKYRGFFGDSTIARIISKYIDVMKLCRRNSCNADLSNLDLSCTQILGSDWNNSNFENARFSKFSFEDNTLMDRICFAYYDEKNKTIIISDFESKIVIFDDYFHTKNIIPLTVLGGTKELQKISIFENHLELFTKYTIFIPYGKEEKVKTAKYFFQTHRAASRKIMEWTSERPYFNRWKKEIFAEGIINSGCFCYADKSSQWKLDVEKNILTLHHSNVIRKSAPLFSRHETSAEIYIGNGFFEYQNNEKVQGHIYVENLFDGRVFDLDSKKCTMFYRHGKHPLKKTINLSPYTMPIHNFNSQLIFQNGGKVEEITVPIGIPFTVCEFKQNNILCYNSTEIVEYSFLNKMFSFLRYDTKNIISIKYIADENSLYILNNTEKELLLSIVNLQKEDCKHYNIGFSLDYGILSFDTQDAEELAIDDKCSFRVEMTTDKIYILAENRIYIYLIKHKWTFVVDIKNLGIKNATDFQVNDTRIILYHRPFYTCISINIPEDAKFLKDTFGTADYHGDLIVDSLEVFQKQIINSVVCIFADDRSCFKIAKEWSIQYLENTDIRGCNFNNAVIKTETGEEKPIPEEILFNT